MTLRMTTVEGELRNTRSRWEGDSTVKPEKLLLRNDSSSFPLFHVVTFPDTFLTATPTETPVY